MKAKEMKPPLAISVSSTINSPTILLKAADLAKQLGLPFVPAMAECPAEALLVYTQEGLKLVHAPLSVKNPRCLLYIDFVHGKNGYRLARDRTIKQPLARAAGIKAGYRPNIFDGTGGLGGDALVLASLGCQVTMCERSPILGALLEDAMLRAADDPATAAIIDHRLRLVTADSKTYLEQCRQAYATIYLDPMYPHRRDSALNQQAMRTIRTLVGDDCDSGALLDIAVTRAGNRVVVKRPRHAPTLTARLPSHVIATKNSRFDIYLTFNDQPS